MPGKRVQFDDETWQAIDPVASQQGKTFQKLADEAFKDLLKKHHQPVGLKAALRRPQQIPPRQVVTFALALCDSVAETDELKSHLAAEPAGIVLAVGLDKHPYWAVEGAEENAGTCGPLPGAGDAYSHMCPKALGRNFRHRCPRFR